MPALRTPTPSLPRERGWYPDPGRRRGLRYFDGEFWTTQRHATPRVSWRLPRWLSWPVVCVAPWAGVFVAVLALRAPLALGFALVPAMTLGLGLLWLERLEPTPVHERIHAALWGAGVVVVVAVVVNTAVGMLFGRTASALVSAPVVEEGVKALVFLGLVRRRKVLSPLTGAVYACWTAAGFALVEDLAYFTGAAGGGAQELVQTFVLRGLLTPFAHLLLSVWVGLAIGAVVRARPSRGRSILVVIGAWLGAVSLHALWNATATGTYVTSRWVGLAIVGLFSALLGGVLSALVELRKLDEAVFVLQVPQIAAATGLREDEIRQFGSARRYATYRRQLDPRRRVALAGLHQSLETLAWMGHTQSRDLDEAARDAEVRRVAIDEARRRYAALVARVQ